MSSATFSQKLFKPTAPDKGSFPLDHEGRCRRQMLRYLSCVGQADGQTETCRNFAKEYLDCRMSNELMDKEEWSKLGFHSADDASKETKEAKS